MTKLKSPLLSLEAHGTIADTLTFQKTPAGHLTRRKPTPAYTQSLAQLYQRWLYQDYAYLWTQQSNVVKRQYSADGSKYHLTGFQYWMKYNLANLPDIAGYWKLDETHGFTAADSSRNSNTGTIFGSSPAVGRINGALSFDGINDYIDTTNNPSLRITDAITLMCFFRLPSIPVRWMILINKNNTILTGYNLFIRTDTHDWNAVLQGVGDGRFRTTSPSMSPDIWYHYALTWDGAVARLYRNGLQILQENAAGSITQYPNPLRIGRGTDDLYPFDGDIDQVFVFNRALSQPEILMRAERRYPL